MKKKKITRMFVFILIIVLFCYGCNKKDSSYSKTTSESKDSLDYDNATDEAAVSDGIEYESFDENGESTSDSNAIKAGGEEKEADTKNSGITNTSATSSSTENAALMNRKLIKTVSMDVETLEYDNLMKSIDKQIRSLKGYVQSSNIEGYEYYSEGGQRLCTMVVRIPKDNIDQFVNQISNESNVISKDEETKDITLEYVDTESHNKALRVEQERLLDFVKEAENIDDIITLETRLSDIRYEIESNESQLRTYDNLVEYSTVNLSITEVERISEVVKVTKKATVFDRIRTGYSKNIKSFINGFQNFTVWFVVSLPYIIVFSLIGYIAFIIYKKVKKSEKLKELNNNKKDLHE